MRAQAQSVPLRRAALALHALPDSDRAWVLQTLARVDVEVLRPLLEELEGLGIPRDPAYLATIEAQPAARMEQRSCREWPASLDANGVAALVRVLAREPVAVTHLLLSMGAWAWAPALLAAMDDTRRQEVQEGTVPQMPRKHVQVALLAALQRELRKEPVPPVTDRRPWQRLLDRMGRRT